MAKWLTPLTLDLEVWGSSLALRVVPLDKELHSTLSLFTQIYINGYRRQTAGGYIVFHYKRADCLCILDCFLNFWGAKWVHKS